MASSGFSGLQLLIEEHDGLLKKALLVFTFLEDVTLVFEADDSGRSAALFEGFVKSLGVVKGDDVIRLPVNDEEWRGLGIDVCEGRGIGDGRGFFQNGPAEEAMDEAVDKFALF